MAAWPKAGSRPLKMRRLDALGFCTQLAKVTPAVAPPSRQSQCKPPALLILNEGGAALIPIGELEARVGEQLKLTCGELLHASIDAQSSFE
jgi:hypothetical protein